jgi:hypothetical protein
LKGEKNKAPNSDRRQESEDKPTVSSVVWYFIINSQKSGPFVYYLHGLNDACTPAQQIDWKVICQFAEEDIIRSLQSRIFGNDK